MRNLEGAEQQLQFKLRQLPTKLDGVVPSDTLDRTERIFE